MPLSPPRKRPLVTAVFLSLLGIFALTLAFEISRRTVERRLTNEAQITALSRVLTLESILSVQRAVAVTLADDGLARRALRHPSDILAQEVSRKLEYLHTETGSTIIYLLDSRGMTISASNWQEPISFVGGDYSFRDYFRLAVRDGEAMEYAMGKDSFRPGLYLSQAIHEDDRLLGVIVVKMEFNAMEEAWARSKDPSFVADPSGRVVLASDPSLRFAPIPAPGGKLAVSEQVDGTPNWQLTLYTSAAPAFHAGLIGAGITAALGAILLALRRRRLRLAEARHAITEAALVYQRDLEKAVAARTQALKSEMEERLGAEERLARMQGELVQANKLATLGQVTAGLAHEVNQPLATIRLLADNGVQLLEIDRDAVRQNLTQIAGMTERIDRITTQLRGFARKATGELRAVSVREAISASILLTASRRRVRGAELEIIGDTPGLNVHAEAVRLEQVLVNLIQNAQEALHETPNPKITIKISATETEVRFDVSDNGPGIPADLIGQVFMPFVTSKSEGLGLGLVIARDIARDLGGELSHSPSLPGQGAHFTLRLNRA